mgnify:CR=1 FL=1
MSENQFELVSTVNSVNSQKKLSRRVLKDNEYAKINSEEGGPDQDLDLMKIERERVVSAGYDDFSFPLPIKIERSKSFCCKKLGNTYALFGDRDGNPLFIIGPHWPMYFCFSSWAL